jgi:PAN domain-containing protein
VYGTSDANNPAANSFFPSSPAPAGSNVEPHLVQTTSIPGGDPRKVRTTRVDTTPAPASAPPPTPLSKPFKITNDTEVVGAASDSMNADSTADCEQKCAQSTSTCNLFAFNKETQQCFLYTSGELRKNPLFDYGVRAMQGIHSETVRRDDGAGRTVPFQQQNR